MKLWLVIKARDTKRTWTKYFECEKDMKESYEIILEKLKKDRIKLDKEIKEIIDEVDTYDYKMRSYQRILGRKQYCEEMIAFFEELLFNLR